MLYDTDILIWCFRGNKHALATLTEEDNRAISAVTFMELMQGARNKNEQRHIRIFLRNLNIAIIEIDESISRLASILVETLSLKNPIGLADALIAATAISQGQILYSGNAKHLQNIPQLTLRIFRVKNTQH